VLAINPGEEKQRNIRKITEDTEDTEWDFGLRDWFLRTVGAEVNQFRQLLENDGKRTEGYEGYLYSVPFPSFSHN
jgi:hypothetical protein